MLTSSAGAALLKRIEDIKVQAVSFQWFGDTKFDEIMSVLKSSWFTVNERASVKLRITDALAKVILPFHSVKMNKVDMS